MLRSIAWLCSISLCSICLCSFIGLAPAIPAIAEESRQEAISPSSHSQASVSLDRPASDLKGGRKNSRKSEHGAHSSEEAISQGTEAAEATPTPRSASARKGPAGPVNSGDEPSFGTDPLTQ